MEIIHEIRDGSLCLKVKGELNINTSKEFEKVFLEKITEDCRKIIVDITEVNVLSSAGIRALIVGAKEIKKQKGSLRIIIPNSGIVKEAVEVCGILSILDIRNSEDK